MQKLKNTNSYISFDKLQPHKTKNYFVYDDNSNPHFEVAVDGHGMIIYEQDDDRGDVYKNDIAYINYSHLPQLLVFLNHLF